MLINNLHYEVTHIFPLFVQPLFYCYARGAMLVITVVSIAYNHLTPQTKELIKRFLGDTSMSDVAAFADETSRQPAYKNTAP